MHCLNILAVSATLLSTCFAAPQMISRADSGADVLKRNSVNDCQDSSFSPVQTDTAARVSDCQVITQNIAGGGTWELQGGQHRTLVSYGTCAMYARRANRDDNILKVGNQDIIDIINTSIGLFGDANGNLNAVGTVDCQIVGVGTSTIEWRVGISGSIY